MNIDEATKLKGMEKKIVSLRLDGDTRREEDA